MSLEVGAAGDARRARGIQIVGPDRRPLPLDGTPFDMARITTPRKPVAHPASSVPLCSLHFVVASAAAASDAALDPELQERLRELGYLD